MMSKRWDIPNMDILFQLLFKRSVLDWQPVIKILLKGQGAKTAHFRVNETYYEVNGDDFELLIMQS